MKYTQRVRNSVLCSHLSDLSTMDQQLACTERGATLTPYADVPLDTFLADYGMHGDEYFTRKVWRSLRP
jgi:hypothetical protein